MNSPTRLKHPVTLSRNPAWSVCWICVRESSVFISDYPTMYSSSDPLSLAAKQAGEPGFEFYLWGQAAALNRECPSAELVQLLVRKAQDALLSAAGTK